MAPLTPALLHPALAAFGGAALLHVNRVPLWCAAVAGLALAWRLLQQRGRLPAPGKVLRVLLVLALTAATLATSGRITGLAAGSTLLLAMGAAKTLETRSRRDGQVLVFTSLLLLLAACLDQQQLWRLPLYAGSAWLACTALAALGGERTDPSWRVSLSRAGGALVWALPLAAVLFLFVPRLPGALWALPANERAQTGLSDEMTPGGISELAVSEAPVFRVRFDRLAPPPTERYWRGPVLHQFDGYTWTRGPRAGVPLESEPLGEPLRHSVMLEPSQRNWLFALDTVVGLSRRGSLITWDGQVITGRAVTAPTAYEAISHLRVRTEGPLPRTTRRIDTQLPAGRNPRSVALARQMRAAAADERAFVAATLALFRDGGFRYTLTPPLLDLDSVDDLLFNTRRGFCGHFASAFAMLMRAAGIPARVVTGYQGGEWNRMGGYLLIRQSHAHAWTEVWLEGEGWTRVDPTAVVAPERLDRGLSDLLPGQRDGLDQFVRENTLLQDLAAAWDATNHWWQERVVNFNQAAQRGLLERLGLRDADWRALAWLLMGGALLWALAAAAWHHRRPRAPTGDPVALQWRRLRALLAARGLQGEEHEPPLALGNRAMRAWPEAAPALSAFVQAYVQARFGREAPPADVRELRALLRDAGKAVGRRPPLDDFADISGLPLRGSLPDAVHARVSRLATDLLARVHFEGCGGLQLTPYMRRVIAYQACVPIAAHGAGVYADLRAVLVYPDVFVVPQHTEDEAGVVTLRSDVLSGQTEDTSRVLLSWQDIEAGIAGPAGYNVVLHEFAHVIDHALSGTLSRRDGEGDANWHDVFEAEYEALCAEVDQGAGTLIDPYGAEDPAEFFAVCTETFFELPRDLRELHPRLYAALARLYRLEPADWGD